jgi:hypothetical protein
MDRYAAAARRKLWMSTQVRRLRLSKDIVCQPRIDPTLVLLGDEGLTPDLSCT